MPEAAEAQLKIANIHYQQMEKADRDYTHAKRAEDEYRKVILQYPDSKLVPEAKQRLLEVQEVLGEREFGIGRFYYLRESYPASIARLQSSWKNILYTAVPMRRCSCWDRITKARSRAFEMPHRATPTICRVDAQQKVRNSKYIGELTKKASESYDKILTRYPMMDRSEDAKKRLTALHQAVPRPTKGAVAQNKAEIASRNETTMAQRFMGLIKKGPDMARASTVGEPTWSILNPWQQQRLCAGKPSQPPGSTKKPARRSKS